MFHPEQAGGQCFTNISCLLKPRCTKNSKETYGFGSTKSPPVIPELKQYEDGLLTITKKIQYRKITDKCHNQLEKDNKDMKRTDKLIIPADKTTNFYKMDNNAYRQILETNFTKGYKKAPEAAEKNIATEDKAIATKLEIDDIIDITDKKQAFITLKITNQAFRTILQADLLIL